LDVHLIDGTYELFRHYYALPSARDSDGPEVAAVRGVLASVLGMVKAGSLAKIAPQQSSMLTASPPTASSSALGQE